MNAVIDAIIEGAPGAVGAFLAFLVSAYYIWSRERRLRDKSQRESDTARNESNTAALDLATRSVETLGEVLEFARDELQRMREVHEHDVRAIHLLEAENSRQSMTVAEYRQRYARASRDLQEARATKEALLREILASIRQRDGLPAGEPSTDDDKAERHSPA